MNPQHESDDLALKERRALSTPLVSVMSGEELSAASAATKARKRQSFQVRLPRLRSATAGARNANPFKKKETRPEVTAPLFSPATLGRIDPSSANAEPQAPQLSSSDPDSGAPAALDAASTQSAPARRFHLGIKLRLPKRSVAIAFIIASMAGAAILASSLIVNSHPIISLPNEDSAQAALMAMLEPDPATPSATDALLPPLPSMLVERSYTVRRGDTLQTIARQFGLREDTLISANNLSSKSQLQVGKTLKVPNMNGVYHSVRRNENLSKIASLYGIDMTRIADANNMASAVLKVGDRLFIPNAKLDASVLRNFYGTTFIWPARGPISSPFGYRSNPFSGQRTFHAAIDIVVNRGTPVKATREGKVADTGYNAVFGNYVIIRHSDGYQSLYAHLDRVMTKKGASVNQGEVLGLSGNTGQSTGPHLHFGIFHNGQAVDPRKYVK